MTFDELAASLPNGFHDAELHGVEIDYIRAEARLALAIWLGDELEMEAYRPARVILSRLALLGLGAA